MIQAELARDAERADEPLCSSAVIRCVDAWRDLSTCRGIGMSTGPVPVPKIYWWAEEVAGMDRESAQILKVVIRQLDNERAEAEAARQRLDAARGGTQ